jgi:hypothetical protein
MSATHAAVKPGNYVKQVCESTNTGNINDLIFSTYLFNHET